MPTKKEFNELIDKIFNESEDSQPRRILNLIAGIVDVSFILALFYFGQPVFICGIVVIELILWRKNRQDTHVFLESRKSLVSELRIELLKTVEKKKAKSLVSKLDKESRKGLTTVKGSRFEGIAGSFVALLGCPIYYPLVHGFSGFVENFIRSFPLQIPPYTYVDFLVAIADLIIKAIFYLAVSALVSYDVHWLYEKLYRNHQLESRERRKNELEELIANVTDRD